MARFIEVTPANFIRLGIVEFPDFAGPLRDARQDKRKARRSRRRQQRLDRNERKADEARKEAAELRRHRMGRKGTGKGGGQRAQDGGQPARPGGNRPSPGGRTKTPQWRRSWEQMDSSSRGEDEEVLTDEDEVYMEDEEVDDDEGYDQEDYDEEYDDEEEDPDDFQGIRGRWGEALPLGNKMKLRVRDGHRAAVMEYSPGLYVVAEVPERAARADRKRVELGLVPLVPILVKRAVAAVITNRQTPAPQPPTPAPLPSARQTIFVPIVAGDEPRLPAQYAGIGWLPPEVGCKPCRRRR